MPRLADVALATTSSKTRYGHEGAARLVNCYPQPIGDSGKSPLAIYAWFGSRAFATLIGGGAIRAAIEVGTTLYVVSGQGVFAIDQSGTAQLIGSIEGEGFVTMAHNRRQPVPDIAIVDSNGLYYLIRDGVLTQPNDPDLPPPIAVIERDGYFLFPIRDGRLFLSGINDGTTVDGLDFVSAEARSDQNVMAATRGKENVVFGTESTEFFVNTGDADVPFQSSQSVNIGCWAAGSVSEITATINGVTVDSIIWAGTDEQGRYNGIKMLNGYGANTISIEYVDRLIEAEPNKAALRSASISRGGHVFYVLSGTAFTVVYDTTQGIWFDLESYGLPRWYGQTCAVFAGRHIVGHYDGNMLLELRDDVEDEAGQPIVMTIQTPPVHAHPYKLQHHELHIDVVPGVGLNSADPALKEPKIMIAWSDDGGHTWSLERQEDLGRQGERMRRVVTRRLGTARSRTYRFSISAAVARGVLSAKLLIDQLAA